MDNKFSVIIYSVYYTFQSLNPVYDEYHMRLTRSVLFYFTIESLLVKHFDF